MGFYKTGSSGTVFGPTDYDAEAASKKLFEGMKGLGTEENVIVEVIAGHTNEQRQEIKEKYKTMFGKDLVEDLESELGGSFSKIVLALMKDPEEYIIECINQAISGLGTDEYALIGLLCTRTNGELAEMKKAYKEKYEKEMEEDVAEDLSGDFRSLIVGIINGGRDESDAVDLDKVQEDVKELHEASEGAGTREEVFQSIFNQRSYEHMRQAFDSYKELSEGKEIEELIDSEFSGSLKEAYLALAKIFKNVSEFYAERLRSAIKGAGTDDDTLIQIIVLRSEIDLKDIIDNYESQWESSLLEDVAGDTSGDYKLILEKLLNPPASESGEEAVEEEIAAKTIEADESAPPEEGAEGEGAVEDEVIPTEETAKEVPPQENGEESKEDGGEEPKEEDEAEVAAEEPAEKEEAEGGEEAEPEAAAENPEENGEAPAEDAPTNEEEAAPAEEEAKEDGDAEAQPEEEDAEPAEETTEEKADEEKENEGTEDVEEKSTAE